MGRTRQAAAEAVGTAMQRYQRSVQAFDDAVGARLGLGPADLRCLDVLSEGPRTAGQLATGSGLKAAATTALVDRLSARGLVRRVPDAQDRRRVLVELTEDGAQAVWSLYGPMVEEGTGLLGGFTVAELDRVRDLLEQMRELTERHRLRVLGTEGRQ